MSYLKYTALYSAEETDRNTTVNIQTYNIDVKLP